MDNPVISEDVVYRREGDETFLVHAASGLCSCLDEVGSRVWELLAQGTARQEIAATVAQEFDAPPGVVEQDVLHLLQELGRQGFLT